MENLNQKQLEYINEWNNIPEGFIKVLKQIQLLELEQIVEHINLNIEFTEEDVFYIHKDIFHVANQDQLRILILGDKKKILEINKINKKYLIHYIKKNDKKILFHILQHNKFDYKIINFANIFNLNRKELLAYDIIIENNYILQNVDNIFFKGLINCFHYLKNEIEKKYFCIDILYSSKLAQNDNLINIFFDLLKKKLNN